MEKDGQGKGIYNRRKSEEPTALANPGLQPRARARVEPVAQGEQGQSSHLLPYAMIRMEVLPMLFCLYLARDVRYNFHKD